MATQNSNNKRIAKNTLYLYVRMLVMMLISLYTSRIVLQTLGVEDFGIYNVIGGVVVLLHFLNNAMNNATQRFLSYEIGRGDEERTKKVFSMSINCHIIIAVIVVLLAETIGLWFVNNKLNIPVERINASHFVYQFSLLAFIFSILRVPYNALIISNERMSFYAYSTILESILKLLIAFALIMSPWDRLILYSVMMALAPGLINILYIFYSNRKFSTTASYTFFWDRGMFKSLMSFSGWSMFNGGTALAAQQGSNFLINIFNGVRANAAFGISNQVSSAIYGLVNNFQLAFQPQIVKYYASGDEDALSKLVSRASSISF